MKRLVTYVICILTALSLLTFTGCDALGGLMGGGGDQHNFSTEWSSDETHHWKACTDQDCNEKKDYSEHVFVDYQCECGATDGVVIATASNAASVIYNAEDGQKILLKKGNYAMMTLATQAKGLELLFEKNSTISLLSITSKVEDLTIDGLKFTGNLIISDEVDGLTISNCKFSGNSQISTNTQENVWIKDVVIKDCTFTNISAGQNGKLTAIRLSRTENFSLIGCLFDSVQYNCVQMPGGIAGGGNPSLKGNIVITGNTFKDTGVRALNLHLVEATTCDISGNTFYLHEYSYDGGYIDTEVGASGVVIGVNTWEVIPEGCEKNFLGWDLGVYTYDMNEQIQLEIAE